MTNWAQLQQTPPGQVFTTTHPLDIYDSPALSALATQAGIGRQLSLKNLPNSEPTYRTGLEVCLWEDAYPGWLALEDLGHLEPVTDIKTAPVFTRAEILQAIPNVIKFIQTAQTRSHCYLWGGTLGPSYDCSGLIQASFAAQGIWVPRDAYQQEAFTTPIFNPGDTPEALMPSLELGDLVFFGTPTKATHVGLYLGEGKYIHSSGKDQGRNGIGIDFLNLSAQPNPDPVSQAYYNQFRGAGRIMTNYRPQAEQELP